MGRKRKAGADNAPAAEQEDASGGSKLKVTSGSWGVVGVHPDVVELCDHFHIDDFFAKRLHDTLQWRQETFEADMIRLWCELEKARSPQGLLLAQIIKMEEGTFVGQVPPEKELLRIFKKFKLDDDSQKALGEAVCRQPKEKRDKYYEEIELHLECCGNPSARAMSLLRKIKEGEPLGPASSQKGEGKGKSDKGRDEQRDDRRGEGKGGEQGRDERRDDRRGEDRREQRNNRDYRDYDSRGGGDDSGRDRDRDDRRGEDRREQRSNRDYRDYDSRGSDRDRDGGRREGDRGGGRDYDYRDR